MSNRITIKTCKFCGKTFEAKKSDSMYCSPTCRKYAYIERSRRRIGWRVPETYTSYKHKQRNEQDNERTEKLRQMVRDAFSQNKFL